MTKTLVDLGEKFDKVHLKVPLIVGKVNSRMWEAKLFHLIVEMINVTTVVVSDIIVGIVLHVYPRERSGVSTVVILDIFNIGALYQGKTGFVDHRTIHLKIGETNSKLRHKMGTVFETILEEVFPRIADLLHLGSKTGINLFHQQI